MVQQVNVKHVDDLDGSDASGAVDFSLDGRAYTIDLSDANASKLRDIFAPFAAAARRASGSARRAGRGTAARVGGPRPDREQTRKMREWLRDNGYTVKDRGRLPAELITTYHTHTAAPTPAAAPSLAPTKPRTRRKGNNNQPRTDAT